MHFRNSLSSKFQVLSSARGFTIIELLIFSAIFSIVAITFLTLLVSSVQVQTRQNAAAEVNQQSQLLLDTIQYYVNSSALIEMASDAASTTLKLRMSSSTVDPTYIYMTGGTVYLKQTDSGTEQPLTSNKVIVSDLSFTKRVNPGGRDSVNVNFTMSYNATNIKQSFLQSLSISVARVGAATFDSNVVPATSNTYKIGASSQIWQSINDIIYFSGSNVGIGVSSPGQTLEVNGGLRLNTTVAQPTCDTSQRGAFWVTQSASGTKDAVTVCAKDSSNAYSWRTIY